MSEEQKKPTVATLNKVFLCNSSQKGVAGEEYEAFQEQNIHKKIKSQLIHDSDSISKGLFNILNIPIIRWQYDLITIGHYIASDFRPHTNDEDFLVEHIRPIWEQIISKAYFGEIFVGYGEDLIAVERAALEADGKNWFLGNYYQNSKFRIYVRENDEETTFRSVWTNVGNLDLNPERLVRMEFGERMEFFLRSTHLILEDIAGLETFFNCYHTAIKQMVVDVQDSNKAQKEINNLIKSKTPVLVLNNQGELSGTGKGRFMNDNDWDELKTIKLETVDKVANWNDQVYAKQAAKCGIFGKDSTRGGKQDNIQSVLLDMKMVNNMRVYFLDLLQGYMQGSKSAFGRTFGENWRSDFKVYLNSASPHEEQKEYDQGWIDKNRQKFDQYSNASTQGQKGKDFVSGGSNNR